MWYYCERFDTKRPTFHGFKGKFDSKEEAIVYFKNKHGSQLECVYDENFDNVKCYSNKSKKVSLAIQGSLS